MSNIKSLRDVGPGINKLLGSTVLKENTLFRSGELSQVKCPDELPNINTILNLRRTPDLVLGSTSNVSVAPLETMNNYLIELDVFKEWIQRIF